jgi:nucleotide-binding universal stress UspA family protein
LTQHIGKFDGPASLKRVAEPANGRHAQAIMKTILVHMAHDNGRRRRLRTALALASAHRAHLVGLFTRSPHVTPAAIVGRGASPAFLREMEAGLRDQEQQVRSEFDDAVSGVAVSAEWQRHDGEIVQGLAHASHVADLLIVSQTPPETVEDIVAGSPPPHVKLAAGSPGRGSLPILRRASSVTILTCRATRERPGETVKAYLARHDVRAEIRNDFGDNDEIGEIVLAHAGDISADLIVMGAYGHSRLREVILGGTTRHILSRSAVPVLMSH